MSTVEKVARAIWNIRREHEDRCDMELEDMGGYHPVWDEARAALAEMPAPVMTKPLEWVWRDDGTETHDAMTPIGNFIAAVDEQKRGFWFICGLTNTNYVDGGVEAAKAAAQADYEARILSALTPAPDLASENERLPQDVINLVIAAREFWDVAMDESDESAALDSALEAFSSRVPYENEPEEDRAALERT